MTDPILLTPTEAARALGIDGILGSVHIGTCRSGAGICQAWFGAGTDNGHGNRFHEV